MKWNYPVIDEIGWTGEIMHRKEKELLAATLAEKLRDGDVVGAGSGSTVYVALHALAEKIKKENWQVRVIPASFESSVACMQLGIPQITLEEARPDWVFDGADEIDPENNMLKGRGGAMFKEKLLIRSSPRVYILVDQSKFVSRLGTRFPVPVEISPVALTYVGNELKELGATRIELRAGSGKDGPVLTENGNLILDAWFDSIGGELERAIKKITGVWESGLFINYRVEVLAVS